jgi:hypothetical protein
VTYRCVGLGTIMKVRPVPAFRALAIAGLGRVTDTIVTRSLMISMRRRAHDEFEEPYHFRIHEQKGKALAGCRPSRRRPRHRLPRYGAAPTRDSRPRVQQMAVSRPTGLPQHFSHSVSHYRPAMRLTARQVGVTTAKGRQELVEINVCGR